MSCGYYSFTGSIPSDIKTVAVPLFDDNTSFPGVREDLTNNVIDAFINDNTLQVVPESKADLVITGTILSIREKAAIITTGEDVEQYEVYVNVKVKCTEIKSGKVWWEKTLRRFGIMGGLENIDARNDAIETAINEITQDVLDNTLANW
ncbi:MAG: LptE family protein [Calditrichia bacterium]|nr:LptE family protein [Calditrichia bacterium]